jgi:hypothetical protein
MITPRDSPPPPLAVAINYETGFPITDRQRGHLQAIKEAGELLLERMHNAEGSSPPGQHQEHIFQMRRMAIAATHIETALMFARRAALEVK